jgi:integral membrane protein
MSDKKLLSQFKNIAIAEGISFLVLVFIAMPVKYMLGFPLLVKYFGWAHGVLFILYIVWLIRAKEEYNWSLKQTALGLIAALLPFGPFIFNKRLH